MSRSFVSFLGLALTAAGLVLAAPGTALSQDRGTIAGHVRTAGGAPSADARVTLVGARRRAEAGADGSFRFENHAPGSYLVQAESPRSGIAVERVELAPGEVVERELVLDLVFHAEAITVTTGAVRELGEVYQPAGVLGGRELLAQQEPTLGETLVRQPGVNSTYFGPGASRPVIRGLGGDRVRILEGGVGTGDVSNTSPDHAVGVDPLGAERIEIVRGPATLLYGSTAIGGVVNVIDGRIPRFRQESPLSGNAQLTGGTVADERAGEVSLTGGIGNLASHAGVLGREDVRRTTCPSPASPSPRHSGPPRKRARAKRRRKPSGRSRTARPRPRAGRAASRSWGKRGSSASPSVGTTTNTASRATRTRRKVRSPSRR